MTLLQLKRHMDRRFDRLERTKVDKTDLRQFVTKRDSRRFATKRDLRRYATKRDMKASAVDTRRYFDIVAESLRDDIRKIADLVDVLRHHSSVLDHHEVRITDLEQRAGS